MTTWWDNLLFARDIYLLLLILSINYDSWMLMLKNNVKTLREERLMGKAELARVAGVSPITIARIEKGMICRLETQRKILEALGYGVKDKELVFPI
jgi:DNA-binding XRE family transcriptional regulator